MPLIDTSIVTYEIAISEDDLRMRMAEEVLQSFGLNREPGKPQPGVTIRVLRGENRRGGYRIRITRDMSKDPTPRLTPPESANA